MPEQLTFNLPVRAALERDDFFIAPSNALAVQTLDGWADWPQAKMVLCGTKGAGKSHLAQVWAQAVGAEIIEATDLNPDETAHFEQDAFLVVEDIDQISDNAAAQEALFHLHNMMQTTAHSLLFTSTLAPARINFTLADLASRLQATPVVTLEPPDDALLAALLVKLFADRQIMVSPAIIAFAIGRMERSFEAAHMLVARLDARALSHKRAISKPLVALVLGEMNL